MADRIFVIYATNLGTSTARPVLEYYTEDEAHTPDVTLLGYTAANTGWGAIDSLDVLAPASDDNKNKLTINPATVAISASTVARYDVAHAQTQVLGQIADLIAEWNWTQELDAKITRATQQAYATWIEQLEAIPNNALWATNPKGITIPARPTLTTSSTTVAQQIATAGWLDQQSISASKLALMDTTNLVPDGELQDPSAWVGLTSSDGYFAMRTPTTSSTVNSLGDIVFWARRNDGTNRQVTTRNFPMGPDQHLFVSCQMIPAGVDRTKVNCYTDVTFYDNTGGLIESQIIATRTSNSGGSTVSKIVKTPPGTTRMRLRFFVNGDNDYDIVFATPIIRRQNDANLIVDSTIPSQKMNIANWNTLQTIWGYDTDDLTQFGAHPRVSLWWNAGRSGHRTLGASVTGGAMMTAWVRPLWPHSFAMAAGDTFYVEAWVRGTMNTVVNVGLVGFEFKAGQATPYNGGDGLNDVVVDGAVWRRVSGYIQVPNDNRIRWGTVEVTFTVGSTDVWVTIDSLTVTRVPRIPNTYSMATDLLPVTSTATTIDGADTAMILNFFRGGNGAVVKLEYTGRIVPQNATTDQMRLQFWITRQDVGSPTEEILATWFEYGSGAWLHRNTAMIVYDQKGDNKRVEYKLKVSKLTSVNTMSLNQRTFTATLLPRL